MTFTVDIEGRSEVNRVLDGLPVWAYEGARKSLQDYVKAVDTEVKQKLSGIDLKVRTGYLRRSFNFEVHGTSLNSLGASNYTDATYAPIHQIGGTINAKDKYLKVPGGPYLNIPSKANQTPVGVTRMSARQVFAAGGHIVKINAPRARYMVMLQGVPMYWLVKSVTIPKRMHFTEIAEQGIPTLLTSIANSWINPAGT